MKSEATRLILVGYAILAIAATGRSVYQVLTKFQEAPFAYSISAVAAAHYFLALISLAKGWNRVATVIVILELIGVISVGFLTVLVPELFADDTVASYFGVGYGFLPLILPMFGLWWVWSKRR